MKSHLVHTLFVRATYAFTGTLIGRLSAAAAGVIMARSLQAEMFGIYSALWELALLCGSFTDTGMTIGMQREGSRDQSKLGGLLGNALLVRALIGFPALVIAYFFSGKMTAGHACGPVYAFLAVASAAVFLSEPMYSVLQVLGMQKRVAIIESMRGLLSLAGIAGLVLLHRGVTEMACVQGIIYLAMLIWLSYTTLRACRLSFDWSDAFVQFKSSFIYGMSGLVFSIYSRIPILVLSYLKGPLAVGYYAAAYRILSVLYVVGAGAYQRAFLPSLFGLHTKNIDDFRRAGNFMQKYFLIFGFLCSIAAYVGADTIIYLLMGYKYADSVAIMKILSLSVFLNFMLYAGDASMTAADKNYLKIFFQVSGILAGVVAAFLLIRTYGAPGAALTDNVIRITLLSLFITYCYKMRFLDFSSIARFIPATLLIAAAGILSVHFMPKAIIVRPIIVALAVVIIGVATLGPRYLKTTLAPYFTIMKKEPEAPC